MIMPPQIVYRPGQSFHEISESELAIIHTNYNNFQGTVNRIRAECVSASAKNTLAPKILAILNGEAG